MTSNGQTNEFMERWKKKHSEEKDRRTVLCDDVQFWEQQQQKEEYLQQNPTYNLAVAEIEAEQEDD